MCLIVGNIKISSKSALTDVKIAAAPTVYGQVIEVLDFVTSALSLLMLNKTRPEYVSI